MAQVGIPPSPPHAMPWLKQLGSAVLDLLFPPQCVGCHSFGSWLCDRCLDQIEIIRPPVCARCGLPWKSDPSPWVEADPSMDTTCPRCRVVADQLDGLRSCAFHSGPLRQAIHQFKYEDLRVLAAPLGKLMAEAWLELAPVVQPMDAVVPVPLYRTRERERGYNQSALLARELGGRLGISVVEDAVVRTRATAPQVGLDAHSRKTNVKDAFQCVNTKLAGRRVLLVDDVFTTGATLEATCAALRKEGAAVVWGLTLARASALSRGIPP